MQAQRDRLPCQVEVILAGSGLEEFDTENGEARRSRPPGPGVRDAEVLRAFTVVEQYEPCGGAVDSAQQRPLTLPWSAGSGRRPARRLLARLAIAVALVAIPSESLVETEGLAVPSTVAVGTARMAQALPPTVAVPAAVAMLPRPEQVQPQPQPASPRPPTQTPAASAIQMASLRDTFASLNGPFMTFEHCEVRLASADRALARCQGTRNDADGGDASQSPRRVEWTLDFDRAGQRWVIVDSTAR